jgi:acetyltransferase
VPVYVCWVAPRAARVNADLLQEAGVPCFEWPQRTAKVAAYSWRAAAESLADLAVLPSGGAPAASPARPLDPEEGARLLRAAEIPVIDGAVCTTVPQAAEAARRLGFPAVAKVVHPEIVHKSDVGGVRTGLADAAAVAVATADLLALARGARVLVQPQREGVEVVVGGWRDPQFGPVVMVGLGGILVELIDDVAFALAPVGRDAALRRLRGLRGWPLLAGVRGARPVDVDAVAGVVVAVSDLMVGHPEVAELDLNPLLATAEGCAAVDWRVLATGPVRS